MNESSLFGAKEFYGVTLKATHDIKADGVTIQEGEVIARFDNIQIATLGERWRTWRAHGGYDDRTLVVWEETQAIEFKFTQGVFSKRQLGTLTNTKMWAADKPFLVPKVAYVETDGDGQVELEDTPAGKVFVHDAKTGKKLAFTLEENMLTLSEKWTEIVVDYYINYQSSYTTYQIGEHLLRGNVMVEGKTRLKDDETGHLVTGLVTIPRLRIKSGLSMRLGREAIPFAGDFSGEGMPVGTRGDKVVATFIALSDDIDSDI